MDTLLTVKNLNISLDNRPALQNLSFSLERGEVLAVIGPNGSGKTTLLKAILGITPYRGEITFAPGTNVGYVPQKIDADRHLPLNLRDLLIAKCNALHIQENTLPEVLKIVGISHDVLRTPVGHLSGGQFQKALIAFALLGNPSVILFDEPTASLDQLSEEHIYDLMHQLQDERGMSIILISHDLSVVYHYADKVLCVNRELACFGTPEEVLTTENLQRLYMAPHKYFHHLDEHHADARHTEIHRQ